MGFNAGFNCWQLKKMTRFPNNQYNLGDLIDREWQEEKDIFRHKQIAWRVKANLLMLKR